MRLIDADAMLFAESEAYMMAQMKTDGLTHLVNEIVHKKIQMLLAATPTAYDLDKVVAELENEKEIHTEHFQASFYKDFPEVKRRYEQTIYVIDRAIEIVKGGTNDGRGEMD